jgi:hypothetical protein
MSIASEIQRLQQAKASFKQAIEEYSIDVLSDVKLDQYYLYIQQVYQAGYAAGQAAGGGSSSSAESSSSAIVSDNYTVSGHSNSAINGVYAPYNNGGYDGTQTYKHATADYYMFRQYDDDGIIGWVISDDISPTNPGPLSQDNYACVVSSSTDVPTGDWNGYCTVTAGGEASSSSEESSSGGDHEYVYSVSGAGNGNADGDYWEDPNNAGEYINENGYRLKYIDMDGNWVIQDDEYNELYYFMCPPGSSPVAQWEGLSEGTPPAPNVALYGQSSSSSESSSSSSSSVPQVDTVTLSGTDYGLDGTYNWDSAENAYVNGNYKIFWDSGVPEWVIGTVDGQMTYYELYSPSLVGDRSEILGTQEWNDFIGGMTTASLTITAGGGADAEAVQRASNVYGDGVSRRVTGDTEEELRHSALINNDEE